MEQKKIKVTFNNTRNYICPEDNLDHVRRLFGNEIASVEYINDVPVTTPTSTAPVQNQKQKTPPTVTTEKPNGKPISEVEKLKLFAKRKQQLIEAGWEYNEGIQMFSRGKKEHTAEKITEMAVMPFGKLTKVKTN